MRNGTSNRRSRSRNNRGNKGGGTNRSTVYDSNGPEVRIRGTAFQISEKYEALAKDSRSTGDMVMAESYLQHAEHYQRIITEINAQAAAKQEQHNNRNNNVQNNSKAVNKENDETDLSLPASILGGEVNANSEAPSLPVRELAEA